MHKTPAGERRKSLIRDAKELAKNAWFLERAARAPAARKEAQRLQEEASSAMVQAEALKLQARLEDLTVWQMEKVKTTKKGAKKYAYWMATWREGGKTRNVHIGSCAKMDVETARQLARKMKAEAIHVN
jgi:hypothetical protein